MLHQQDQSGLTNPWKYASSYLDSSTNLYKFGTRYEDPSLGRWTQQDPVGGSLGDLNAANRYTYASDDPVNEVDPTGAATVTGYCIGAAIVAVLALLIATFETGGLAAVFLLSAFSVEYAAAIGCFLGIIGGLITDAITF